MCTKLECLNTQESFWYCNASTYIYVYMYLNQHTLCLAYIYTCTTRDSTVQNIAYMLHCIYVAALNVPVYRAQMNVVVGIDLHQEASTDITV